MSSRNFDGVDDYVQLVTFPKSPHITVMAWVRIQGSAASVNDHSIYAQDSGDRNFQFRISDESGVIGACRGIIFIGGSNFAQNTSVLTLNRWHHCAMTYDGETLRMFLDGVADGVNTTPTGDMNTGDSDFVSIGARKNGTSTDDHLNGQIANVLHFDRPLSIGEIKQLMSFPGSIANGRLLYHRLSGIPTEPDLSGGGFNGTVVGSIFSAQSPPISGQSVIPSPMGSA